MDDPARAEPPCAPPSPPPTPIKCNNPPNPSSAPPIGRASEVLPPAFIFLLLSPLFITSILFQVHSPTKLVAPSEPELQDNLPGSSKNPIVLESDGEGLEKRFR